MTLEGKTLFISGGSRGIGLAIALRAARDGANVALIAKTAEPHPKLEGTVYTAAEQIEAAGGQALPIVGDIRDEASVAAAVDAAVERFGGIDVVRQQRLRDRPARHRGARPQALRPDAGHQHPRHLRRHQGLRPAPARAPQNPHILTLSPPIGLKPQWLGPHIAYTIAKYGMSLCALGLAEEFREAGIASNALWPRTLIATAAVQNLLGGDAAMARARRPEVYADAAYAILTRPSRECTGNTYLCEDVLAEEGVTDLSPVRLRRRRASSRSTCSSTTCSYVAVGKCMWAGSGDFGPAGRDDLGARVEADALGAVDVVVAEQRLLPAAEGVEGHRHRDRDVDADHADLDLALEVARGLAGGGEDRDAVGVGVAVDQLDRLVERVDAHDGQHRAEDLVGVDATCRW